jgi:hypothetical protein
MGRQFLCAKRGLVALEGLSLGDLGDALGATGVG